MREKNQTLREKDETLQELDWKLLEKDQVIQKLHARQGRFKGQRCVVQ